MLDLDSNSLINYFYNPTFKLYIVILSVTYFNILSVKKNNNVGYVGYFQNSWQKIMTSNSNIQKSKKSLHTHPTFHTLNYKNTTQKNGFTTQNQMYGIFKTIHKIQKNS